MAAGLAKLLRDAFTTEPLAFDEQWFFSTNPPPLLDDKASITDDFAVLHQMICYQIADLHRMAQAGILDLPYLHLGVDSPTGHRWFKFHPCTYLRCAIQPVPHNNATISCTWETLSIILWLG